MSKNTDSGKTGEKIINKIFRDYLNARIGLNGGLIDDYNNLTFGEDCEFVGTEKPRKKLIDGSIKKDGYWLIHSLSGHRLLIINENKHKGSERDSGSILDSYENELLNKLPRSIKHFDKQGVATLVVGLFSITGLPRTKNWNFNDNELTSHLYEEKIWFNRQPGIKNIHAELDDIFRYYSNQIGWEDRPELNTHLKAHLGIQ